MPQLLHPFYRSRPKGAHTGIFITRSGGFYAGNKILKSRSTGVNFWYAKSPILRDNVISKCPNAIGVTSSTGEIVGNTISSNVSGIVIAQQADLRVVQNLIYDNTEVAIQWDVSVNPSSLYIVHNSVVSEGKAISAQGGSPKIVNNIVVGHPAVEFLTGNLPSDGVMNNVLFADAGTAVVGGPPGLANSNGNIAADPLFLDRVEDRFEIAGTSPAVDRGSSAYATASDFLGVFRSDGKPDAGAFEFPGGPPRIIKSVAALSYPDHIYLWWKGAFDGATNFIVRRSYTGGDDFETIGESIQEHIDDFTVQPGRVVYYSIAAQNNLGVGPNSVPISLRSGNHPPEAIDDQITLAEDTVITFDLLANDRDSDGDALQLVNFVLPEIKGLSITNSTVLRYAPPANYFGTNYFEYVLTDGQGAYSTGKVTLAVQSVNDLPTLRRFDLRVAQDVDTWLSPTAFIRDVDSTNLQLVVTQQGGSGYVEIVDRTNFIYRAERGFVGNDVFRLAARDESGIGEEVVFPLEVQPQFDLDYDRMPDSWEFFWGVTQPDADDDGDGFTNFAEYVAATDPRDKTSNLKFTKITRTLEGFTALEWMAAGGVRYRVLSADTLDDFIAGKFQELTTDISEEMGLGPRDFFSLRTFFDTRSSQALQRFYVIKVVFE